MTKSTTASSATGSDPRLTVVHPSTGEVIDLTDLEDLVLGMLLDESYASIGEWNLVQRGIRAEIANRAKDRGYEDAKRRVYVRTERRERVIWEQLAEVKR